MKKTSIILLSVLYFLVASGFTMNLHYCASKLKGISLLQSEEKGCCGNKKKSKGCCKQKTLVYKIKDKHQADAKTIVPNAPVKQLLANYTISDLAINKPSIALYRVPDCNAPPYPDPEPAYLLNRNFRI